MLGLFKAVVTTDITDNNWYTMSDIVYQWDWDK